VASDAPLPLVFNPTAGRGLAAKRAPAVSRMLDANGVPNELCESQGPGNIEKLVAEAMRNGRRRILVAGGDGSVHEAVNGIMRAPGDGELGVIPIGTGNDFAKACSIPLHWEHAAALLADRIVSGSPAIALDVGRMNGRYFANGCGIGFDARVAAIANGLRLPIGDLVYLAALFRALSRGPTGPGLRITFGNITLEGAVTLANFANGPYVGGIFHIAPEAQIDDGVLELIYAEPVTRFRVLQLLPKLLRGTHMDELELHSFGIRSCRVEAEHPVIAHLDGEVLPPAKYFEIELLPGAIGLL